MSFSWAQRQNLKTSDKQQLLLLLSHFSRSDSVRPHRRQPTRLLWPQDSPGKNTGVGCHVLLHLISRRCSKTPHNCDHVRKNNQDKGLDHIKLNCLQVFKRLNILNTIKNAHWYTALFQNNCLAMIWGTGSLAGILA